MQRTAGLIALLWSMTSPAFADEDVVRLPGQGELKPEAARQLRPNERLIPGAGLFISFDNNTDGRVSPAELERGIANAFIDADANQNGYLTPLEQKAWSNSLPTRDQSLSNPARFDPNLDRIVSVEEFETVIKDFAASLTDAESGDILLASLKARRSRGQNRTNGAGPNEQTARPPSRTERRQGS
ncbi:MAG: EF-hand domain-containing protein [Pseudomonadota bacterium]